MGNSLCYQQQMALSALIYNSNLETEESVNGQTIGTLLETLDPSPGRPPTMQEQEWADTLAFIREDATLMNLNVSGFESDPYTGFRAMTVTYPGMNPTAIFRGSAGYGHQWHNNTSPASGIAYTPHQQFAQEYILRMINAGHSGIDVAGHSLGGQLAETMALLFPPHIVNSALSFGGPNQSSQFLATLTPAQLARLNSGKIFSINVCGDAVPLLGHNNSSSNTRFFMGGDFGFWAIKDPHCPSLFLNFDMNQTMDFDQLNDTIGRHAGRLILDGLPNFHFLGRMAAYFFTDQGSPWGENYYRAMIRASEIYVELMGRRNRQLTDLFEMLGLDLISFFEHVVEDDTKVVEGAIISCSSGDTLGEIQLPTSHGSNGRGQAIVGADDDKAENIIFEGGKCYALSLEKMREDAQARDGENPRESWQRTVGAGIKVSIISPLSAIGVAAAAFEVPRVLTPNVFANVPSEPCEPLTAGNGWKVTRDEVTVSDGESMHAVLRKSVLVCDRGGVIQIVLSGQGGLDSRLLAGIRENMPAASWERQNNIVHEDRWGNPIPSFDGNSTSGHTPQIEPLDRW